VVERRSLAGELSLSCARPAADGWPLMWASHPLQVSQLGQLTFGSINWVVSWNKMCAAVYRYRHLVKATEVTAGLAESNGSLLPGLWRDSPHVTSGLTACTPGSAPGPTLGSEYRKTLPFIWSHYYSVLPKLTERAFSVAGPTTWNSLPTTVEAPEIFIRLSAILSNQHFLYKVRLLTACFCVL